MMVMNDGGGRRGPDFLRLLAAGCALDHVTLGKKRDELLWRLGGRRHLIDKADDANDQHVDQGDQEDPFPEMALSLQAQFLLRLRLRTSFQVETDLLFGGGRSQPARLNITGGVLHDLVVLYIVVLR